MRASELRPRCKKKIPPFSFFYSCNAGILAEKVFLLNIYGSLWSTISKKIPFPNLDLELQHAAKIIKLRTLKS